MNTEIEDLEIEDLEIEIKDITEHLDTMNEMFILNKEVIEFSKKYNLQSNNSEFEFDIEKIHPIINIAKLDITLVLKSIISSKSELETKHIIKKGLLTTFELFESIKTFNKILKEYSQNNTYLLLEYEKIEGYIKPMRKVISGEENRIKEIRDNTVAHINSDFTEYYKHFKKINIKIDTDILIKFKNMLNKIDSYLYSCMKKTLPTDFPLGKN